MNDDIGGGPQSTLEPEVWIWKAGAAPKEGSFQKILAGKRRETAWRIVYVDSGYPFRARARRIPGETDS